MTVRVGSDSKHEGGVIHKVAQIIVHEKYNALIKDNDISLIKVKEILYTICSLIRNIIIFVQLEQPLKFSKKVKAITLQETGKEVPVRTKAMISGWGATVVSLHLSDQLLS